MAFGYIDETGLHLADYPTILAEVQNWFRGIYGQDLYLEPDSQEGQMLAIFALALHDAYSFGGSVYNAYSPQTAQGAGLSRMVVINGLRRQVQSRSTVDVTLIGQRGTVIYNGIVEDVAGNRWLLPVVAAIGLNGETTVTATAEEPGDVRAARGEVNTITTPTRGWQSVTNDLPATPGAPVETDAELRARQVYSTALPSRTVYEGTLGAVAAVPGVIRWRGYENDSSLPDWRGIPGHHICVVVEGGDAQAIADVIAVKKTPGCGTHGDITLSTRDEHGVPNEISFFRPTNRAIMVTVRLSPRAGYLSSTADAIKKGVSDYINALPIGESVLHSRLYCPVNDADVARERTFDILSITLGRVGDPLTAANVFIGYTDAAICYADDVEVLLG